MKKFISHLVTITSFLFFFSGSLTGQTSIIEGYVKQGPTGTPMAGINIVIPGSGSITDVSGHYIIPGITTGDTITVSVSVVGYSGSKRTIEVTAGTNRVDFWFNAVTDTDGNSYGAIEIGSQVWMGENLKTTRYNDGTSITLAEDKTIWLPGALPHVPGYCWFNNDETTYKNLYGAIYNWYAVNTGKLCPAGWHVPANAEWHQLVFFIDSGSTVEYESLIAGGKLKETGTVHWLYPNEGATNEYGFMALPGGYRLNGDFTVAGWNGSWWTSTEYSSNAWYYSIHYDRSRVNRAYWETGGGFSVRCVRDGEIVVTKPRLATTEASSVTQTSALSGGNVADDGNSPVLVKGVCWSTNPNPTVDLITKTSDGDEIGIFSSFITDLTPGRTYYVRAYATNSIGTAYGNEIVFSTPTDLSKIQGYVKFGPNRDIMPGTTIQIKDTTLGATVNSDGLYQISYLQPGTIITISVFLAGNIRNERTILVVPGPNFANFWIDAVEDTDGNSYSAIEIDGQIWMGENLKTTRYRSGELIGTTTPATMDISGESTPKYQWAFNGDENNVITYGRLYTWYAATDNRNLCPLDWHVPTIGELTTLQTYLGGESVAGSQLKEAGKTHWNDPNADATNATGFSALPGGGRPENGIFNEILYDGNWWTTQDFTASDGRSFNMRYGDGILFPYVRPKNIGYSVRCIKDTSNLVVTRIDDDSDPGSLRSAIMDANSTSAKDKIFFNIPGKGPFIIRLNSALPTISNSPIIIDGYTQPGSSDTTATRLIELDGTGAGSISNGLTINADFCLIKGLVIKNFAGNGIQITSGNGNKISSNSIYNNGRISGNGIQITSGTGNTISANSIYNNGGLGIDLLGDGVTLNDIEDMDPGPNKLQNFPRLDNIIYNSGEVKIIGYLPGVRIWKYYTYEFFASESADNTRYGEGQTYLGSAYIPINNPGEKFELTFPYKTVYGDVITATVTDPDGNTSEFSKAVGGFPDQILNNMPFHYMINGAGVPKISADTIRNVVNKSFNTWSGVQTANISFTYDGPTASKYANASDSINLVSFTDDQYPFSPGVIAITAKTTKVGAKDADNKILDADIVFNPYFVKTSVYNLGIADNLTYAGYFDIQSITTHEIGHILGLLHSGVYYSTMFFQIGRGTDFRSLEQDDKSWASCKYPLATYHGFGSVSGNITYGYENHPPVAGALVLAINTATKDTVHAYSDANGHYLVPGLVQGSYNLYIEPLDGTVRGRPLTSRNISLYIYLNTKYTDYPGEFYSGTAEADVESVDNATPVSVITGSETTGKNFITNKDVTPPYVVSVTPPDPKISPDILIRFSEPVDINTFSAQSCYLIKSGDTKTLSGSYTVMGDSTHIILFTPDSALNFSTSYSLHITSGVTDLKGNGLSAEYQSSFKTGQDDKQPPTVTDVIPENGADSVFIIQKIMLFFSEPMDKTSVINSLSVTPVITYTHSWDNENKVLTVVPKVRLSENTTYTITLLKSVKDLSGNAMAGNKTFTFKTVPVAAPAIIYLGPGNNKTNITVSTPVVVDFSEPINTSTIPGNFSLASGGTQVPGSFEFLNDNSRVIFRPEADLEFNTTYFITLDTLITDVSQPSRKMLKDSVSMFTTASKPQSPHVEYIDPPAGTVGAVVIISGSGFDPNPANNSVAFSGTNASWVPAVIDSASLTSLWTKVPLGAISGPFTVTVNGKPMGNEPTTTYFFVVPESLYPPCDLLISNIGTGSKSRDVACTREGATAYVTNSGSNSVSVIDMATLTTKYTISVGETPLKIDINPEGTRAYVTNFTSHTVSVIDLTKKPEVVCKTINVGINPYGVAVSPDGKSVYVANYTSENISIIDVDPTSGGYDHAVANINTGTRNRDLDIKGDAGIIAVAGDNGLKLIKVNRTDLGFDYGITNVSSGTRTRDVTINPQAALAFVTTLEGDLMAVDIDPASSYFGAVVANVNTGSRGGDVKVDYNNMFIYVTNPDDNQVSVYQLTGSAPGSMNVSSQPLSLTLYQTINAGTGPEGLFINPKIDAYQLFVVNSGGVTGKNGSVSVFRICCTENTASEDIGNVILVIQGMISHKIVKEPLGEMLISKMNDALMNIARGKTKTAINSLTAFIGKIKDLMKSKQIPTKEGNELIDAANKIIAKLKVATKSGTIEPYSGDFEKPEPDLISVSGIGTAYPNPFSETITINYEIADNRESFNKVALKVYDMNGRLVSTLVDQMMQMGRYAVTWNGKYENGGRAPYGTYFVLFRTGNVEEVRAIMLIK